MRFQTALTAAGAESSEVENPSLAKTGGAKCDMINNGIQTHPANFTLASVEGSTLQVLCNSSNFKKILMFNRTCWYSYILWPATGFLTSMELWLILIRSIKVYSKG